MSELPTASLGMRTHVANATVSKSVHRLGAKKKDFREGNPSFLVEAAGKRVIKQLIIVFDDAPEGNKELKE